MAATASGAPEQAFMSRGITSVRCRDRGPLTWSGQQGEPRWTECSHDAPGQFDAGATSDDPYAWAGDRVAEERRLVEQSRLFGPFTEQYLREAGLGPGMRVVDLGSGAGDTAILAASLVGPTGSVLGIERSSEQADLARRRIAAMVLDNVTFHVGDVAGLDELLAGHPTQVDAVIGRLILMWVQSGRPCSAHARGRCARGAWCGSSSRT